MRKILIIIIVSVLINSCSEINRTENLLGKIENLRIENDSLMNIIMEINQKYVFDSLSVREISYPSNSHKLHSIYRTEIVFVGYNSNGNSTMVFGDDISYEGGKGKVVNGDTLILRKGGFLLERKLTSKKNSFWGILRTENEYGKPHESNMLISIKTK